MGRGYNPGYVFGITLAATLGGLLFGYDTAVILGAEKSLEAFFIQPLNLGAYVLGATILSALIGCIIGGILSGFFTSALGRKKSLLFASCLFFISALGSAYPEFLFFDKGEISIGLLLMFNLYRILGGIGIGMVSAVVPVYIAETAPAAIRGRLVSLNQLAIIAGVLLVYFVSWGVSNGHTVEWINSTGWRYIFASEAIPAAIFGLMIFFIPETPRYLALTRQDARALGILEKICDSKEKAQRVLFEIKGTVSDETKSPLYAYGKKVIITGVLLLVLQQFVGINVAFYSVPRIFRNVFVSNDASMLQTIVMGLVVVISILVAIFTVDKWGRKPLLIAGSVGMAVSMFAIAILAHFNIIGISTLVFIIIYTASFMVSWGPVCWVLIAEIFPNKIRGQSMAVAITALWAIHYLISLTYPVLIQFSGALMYIFYGIIAILSALFVWKMIPETKGKTLEEIEKVWVTDDNEQALNTPKKESKFATFMFVKLYKLKSRNSEI